MVLGVGGLSYDGVSTLNLSRIQVTGDILVSSADAMTVSGSVISGTGDVALESLNSDLNVLGTVTSGWLDGPNRESRYSHRLSRHSTRCGLC